MVVGVFVENPTPFMEEFLHKFVGLKYPKEKIHLYIHNGVCINVLYLPHNLLILEVNELLPNIQAEYHAKQIDGFIESHGKEYKSVKLIRHEDNVKEWHARNLGM